MIELKNIGYFKKKHYYFRRYRDRKDCSFKCCILVYTKRRKRLASIEGSSELQLQQECVVRLESRLKSTEGNTG